MPPFAFGDLLLDLVPLAFHMEVVGVAFLSCAVFFHVVPRDDVVEDLAGGERCGIPHKPLVPSLGAYGLFSSEFTLLVYQGDEQGLVSFLDGNRYHRGRKLRLGILIDCALVAVPAFTAGFVPLLSESCLMIRGVPVNPGMIILALFVLPTAGKVDVGLHVGGVGVPFRGDFNAQPLC